MTLRAVVLEVQKGTCTVVTSEGEFRRVKMRGDLRPGQEITLPETRWRINRMALVAACLLLFFFATTMWQSLVPPAVAAYVSLEVNPAVELALDRENTVVGIRSLDEGGQDLVSGLDLKGLPVEKAVDRIIAEALNRNFIKDPDDSAVVVTVTPAGDYNTTTVERLVKDSAETSLRVHGVSARIMMGSASLDIREKAENAGISTGRFMLFQDAAKKGFNVGPQDFKGKSIPKIEREQKIKVKDALEVEVDREKHGRSDATESEKINPRRSSGDNRGEGWAESRGSDGDRPGQGPRSREDIRSDREEKKEDKKEDKKEEKNKNENSRSEKERDSSGSVRIIETGAAGGGEDDGPREGNNNSRGSDPYGKNRP